jgi:tetratricopeptide (TPR) repeat protein
MDWGLESGDLARSLAPLVSDLARLAHVAPSEAAAAGAALSDRTRELCSVERVGLLDSLVNIEGRRSGRLGVADRAQEELALARKLGERGLIAKALADAAWADPDPERSLRLMDEAVELAEQGARLPFEFFLEARLAYARAVDDRERLVADGARLLGLGRSIKALNENAWVSLRLGDHDEALAYALESRGVLEQDANANSGWRGVLAETLGAVQLFRHELREAAKELRAAVGWYSEVDFEFETRWDLYALASAHAADEPDRAAVLRGAAGDLEPVVSRLCWLRTETQALSVLQAPLDALPADPRARLEAIGRTMPREEAVAYALIGPLPGARASDVIGA